MTNRARVLVVYFSQTGRTRDVLGEFLRPLRESAEVELDEVRLEPVQPYPYPWPATQVLALFPEVVLEKPIELKPISIDRSRRYDLVVLGCQVWFLSSSLPVVSFLNSQDAAVLAGTPVVPVLTFRKAWSSGLRCVEKHVERLGGTLAGKVVVKAQDRSGFALLKALRKDQPEDGKDYHFNPADLERVAAMGRQVVAALTGGTGAPLTSLPPESAQVLPPRRARQEMTIEERLIEDFEAMQKQRYLRAAGFIVKLSGPQTLWRRVLTACLAPFFMPPIYWKVPFLIASRLVGGRR